MYTCTVYRSPQICRAPKPGEKKKGTHELNIVIIAIKNHKGRTEQGGKLELRGRVKLPGESRDPEGRMCLDILPVKDAPWVSFVRGPHSF